MGLLSGKKALVTGGSRGIGHAIVNTILAEGGEVAFTYLQDQSAAEQTVATAAEAHPDQGCRAFQCDVGDTEAMHELTQQVTEEFGQIDVLVNNAGLTRDATFARMSRQDWDQVIETNLSGMYNATQPLVLEMVKRRSGAIVNMTSVVGVYGNSGQVNYAAAKGGIIGFTKALSAEIAPYGVRVNAVAPGYIATDMLSGVRPEVLEYAKSRISMRRLGTPEDVAPLVCFLASDQAGYITGQIVQVDGGITL